MKSIFLSALLFFGRPAFSMCGHWPPDRYPGPESSVLLPGETAKKCGLAFLGKLIRMESGYSSKDKSKACSLDRHMKVIKPLFGKSKEELVIHGEDGCFEGCPPLLSGNGIWLIFASKSATS